MPFSRKFQIFRGWRNTLPHPVLPQPHSASTHVAPARVAPLEYVSLVFNYFIYRSQKRIPDFRGWGTTLPHPALPLGNVSIVFNYLIYRSRADSKFLRYGLVSANIRDLFTLKCSLYRQNLRPYRSYNKDFIFLIFRAKYDAT